MQSKCVNHGTSGRLNVTYINIPTLIRRVCMSSTTQPRAYLPLHMLRSRDALLRKHWVSTLKALLELMLILNFEFKGN